MNKIGKFFLKRSAVTEYYMAYRQIDKYLFEEGNKAIFKKIKNPPGTWCADPVLFKKGGEIFLFSELYDNKSHKGCIAVSKYISDKKFFTSPEVVIEEPFHMSFPHVFEYKGETYMLPETNEAKQLRIYKMGDDISKWTIFASFDTEEGYSDCVTKIIGEEIYICGTKKGDKPLVNKLDFFKVTNLDNNPLFNKIDFKPSDYAHNLRNGGPIFEYNKDSMRVIQRDDEGIYGSALIFRKIVRFDEAGFDESQDKACVGVDKISVNLSKNIYELVGVHTYGVCDDIEIIDVFVYKISLRGFISHYLRMLKGKKY